jgi:hypothetical protein
MFKSEERAQPVEKAPAREWDGGGNVSNRAVSYQWREWGPCELSIVC